MNRNVETQFSDNPELHIERSRFNKPHTHKTTYNEGDIIPIYLDEIMPGDTVTMDMAHITRMSTPIYPVMDDAYLDTFFFFVPMRLVWDHWKEFWGENNEGKYLPETNYTIPKLRIPNEENIGLGYDKGSLADYFGIPTNVVVGTNYKNGAYINALPFRAYAKIYNDWFRDENLCDPQYLNTGDNDITGNSKAKYNPVTNPNQEAARGAKPCKAAKFSDYFTRALIEPQKGGPALIPIEGVVTGRSTTTDMFIKNLGIGYQPDGPTLTGTFKGLYDDGTLVTTYIPEYRVPQDFQLSVENIGATINDLRLSFALQKFFEARAIGGSRYIEIIKSIYGVDSQDARVQRSEYLGGKRYRINMDQVLQTSSTDTTSPQGNTAAYSCTAGSDSLFTKSFTEHGYLLGVSVVRVKHTYSQGLNRLWSRQVLEDFYNPFFAHLGNMGIKNKEIYLGSNNTENEEIFGYQEAWADYRYKPDILTGAMRPNYAQSLKAWHYGDYYEELPTLSKEWVEEGTENIDQTLAVTSELEDQFISDFYFNPTYVRPMPVYSIPGLIDHV